MESNHSINSTMVLFVAVTALSAVPSTSVLVVSARSVSLRFRHGALTAAGVVLGDIVYILLAVFGLALLVEATGGAFVFVKYAGGLYLLWLSALTWRSRNQRAGHQGGGNSSRLSSFTAGLLITLGDQKAVLFYLGFFPAFVDVSVLSVSDVLIIVGIATVAVGGVKLAYACAASHAGQILGSRFSKAMNALAAAVMFMAGLWVIVDS